MLKIPYGISNFKQMTSENHLYIDRTQYIAKLESFGDRYHVFLRPRRFGKSLFASMLHYYYGQEHQKNFDAIFGKYHIGKHPTPLANTYMVLSMQFSGIDTGTSETTFRDFLSKVRVSALAFMAAYPAYFTQKDVEQIEKAAAPQILLNDLLGKVSRQGNGQKVFVLIDEYDHFANELLAFDFDRFLGSVGKNGFVRKFYETLKEGTYSGVVDRVFITGVLPITLDSLTSGFNMSSNLTTDPDLNEMAGFTEQEVAGVLQQIGIGKERAATVLDDLRQWYDGYLFHHAGQYSVFNPDMILYFAKHYLRTQKYPEDLLDENIASDYTKIRSMFRINNKERENLEVLTKIIEEDTVAARLIKRYSFEDAWTQGHFINLLFYLGILTIQKKAMDELVFRMPNFVIQQLYFQYFYQITLEDARLHSDKVDVRGKLKALAQQNNIQPLITLTENILSQLAREDRAHFSEQHIKAIFASLFYQVGYYNIFSELEVRKGPQEKGRVDLLLTRRPPYEPNFQFVFELKYLPKSKAHKQGATEEEATEQLKAYVAHDRRLQSLDALKAYVLVFVAEKGTVIAI